MLGAFLGDAGFLCLRAMNGREAMRLVRTQQPDLVILDIMMPELSGFEVLEELRKDERTAGLPVVVLTARGDEADAKRGLALGAKRYMNKPFDVRALISEVRRHLGGQEQAAGAPRAIV
jgi:DNA-binding response OmpR family regulator